jgi:hypothetical protein
MMRITLEKGKVSSLVAGSGSELEELEAFLTSLNESSAQSSSTFNKGFSQLISAVQENGFKSIRITVQSENLEGKITHTFDIEAKHPIG